MGLAARVAQPLGLPLPGGGFPPPAANVLASPRRHAGEREARPDVPDSGSRRNPPLLHASWPRRHNAVRVGRPVTGRPRGGLLTMTASTAACSGEAKFLTRPHASRTPHGENYGDTFQSHRKPRRNRAFTSISAPQYSLEHLNIDYLLDQSIQSVAAPGKTA